MTKYKKVPSFWTDIIWTSDTSCYLAIESDHPDFPEIARFEFSPDLRECRAYDQADQLVADLQAGRKDFRKLAKETRKESPNEHSKQRQYIPKK